jgi:hypothetical protein
MHNIRTLLAALAVLTALGGIALGDEIVVTGEVTEVIEVAAPTTPPSLIFPPGSGSWQNAGDIGLNTNSNGWAVLLTADPARMASTGTPADILASAMKVNIAASDTNNLTLVTTPAVAIKTGSAPSSTPFTLYLKQPVAWTDPIHDDYTMTITVTGELT